MAEFGKQPPPVPPIVPPAETAAPPRAAPESELRSGQRRRVLFSGRIVHSRAEMTVDCAIQDISTTGDRVRVSGSDLVGDPLFLINMRTRLPFHSQLLC